MIDYMYIVNKHPILNCSNPSGKMPMNITLLISILNRFSFALGFQVVTSYEKS